MSVEPECDLRPPGYGQLRAVDAEREREIEVLKATFAEGRLDKDEYAGRVGQVYPSRSYAELAQLTADLPAGPLGTLAPESGSVPVPAAMATQPPPRSALAVVSFGLGIASVSVPAWFLLGFLAALLSLVALVWTGWIGRRGDWMAVVRLGLGLLGYMGGIGHFVLPYFGTYGR